MKQTLKKCALLFSTLLVVCIIFSGCGKQPTPQENSSSSEPSVTQKGTRDNVPIVLIPEATNVTIFTCEVASIDASNVAEGYIMTNYIGSNEKVKLQITGPDSVTYTYNLHKGSYEVFPLTAGNGAYTIGIYENVSGTTYTLAISTDIDVTVTNTFGPYLYPNQYVDFSSSSPAVIKSEELAYPANNDLEVVEYVYNYIIENFTYDYDKAATVVSGYLPVVNDVYQANTGICFDYAAVMATMLRSQRIPTRLEVGYMGEEYHAWISVYTEDTGWINGVIAFDGTSWRLLDPTFASTSRTPKKFTTEDSKYTTIYVY